MVEITATVTNITKMVRIRMEAILINSIVEQTTINYFRHLVTTISCGGLNNPTSQSSTLRSATNWSVSKRTIISKAALISKKHPALTPSRHHAME